MTTPMFARRAGAIKGEISLPGDKSISHRALIFAGLARGTSHISGLLEADDIMRTASAVRALGAIVEKKQSTWCVTGCAWEGPKRPLYCGNAGTGVRLLMGAVAGQGVGAQFDGDASLRSRPMARILDPLQEMSIESTSNEGRLPVTILPMTPKPIRFRLPKPSAQIKSAVLLAALGASGETIIEEPILCRDHTERMLPIFGVKLTTKDGNHGVRLICLSGPAQLHAAEITVPGDPSSAAFPLAAALTVPRSTVTARGMMLNPQRIGLYDTLLEMGADLQITNQRLEGGEPVGDITVTYAPLRGVVVPNQRAPSMIDEYPVLAVIAAHASGTTRMEGLAEMRVKESDRLSATEAMLIANGVSCRAGDDWLEVTGGPVAGGGMVITHDDHRIAMAGLILGLNAEQPVYIDDGEMIGTSFTGFTDLMAGLGADLGVNLGEAKL